MSKIDFEGNLMAQMASSIGQPLRSFERLQIQGFDRATAPQLADYIMRIVPQAEVFVSANQDRAEVKVPDFQMARKLIQTSLQHSFCKQWLMIEYDQPSQVIEDGCQQLQASVSRWLQWVGSLSSAQRRLVARKPSLLHAMFMRSVPAGQDPLTKIRSLARTILSETYSSRVVACATELITLVQNVEMDDSMLTVVSQALSIVASDAVTYGDEANWRAATSACETLSARGQVSIDAELEWRSALIKGLMAKGLADVARNRLESFPPIYRLQLAYLLEQGQLPIAVVEPARPSVKHSQQPSAPSISTGPLEPSEPRRSKWEPQTRQTAPERRPLKRKPFGRPTTEQGRRVRILGLQREDSELVKELLSPFGEVTEIQVLTRPRGVIAFANLPTEEIMRKAIGELNRTMFQGAQIDICAAQ